MPDPDLELIDFDDLDRPRSGPKAAYPWDSWLRTDGKAVKLREGRDFDCKQSSFRQMAYEAARNRGLRAHVLSQRDGSLALYAVPFTPEDDGTEHE